MFIYACPHAPQTRPTRIGAAQRRSHGCVAMMLGRQRRVQRGLIPARASQCSIDHGVASSASSSLDFSPWVAVCRVRTGSAGRSGSRTSTVPLPLWSAFEHTHVGAMVVVAIVTVLVDGIALLTICAFASLPFLPLCFLVVPFPVSVVQILPPMSIL